MTVYKYKAYDTGGKSKTGQVTANSLDAAEQIIEGRSLTIISIVPLLKEQAAKTAGTKAPGAAAKSFGSKKVKTDEVAAILRNLAVMSESGVPLIDALNSIALSASNPTIAEAMRKIKTEVTEGKSLASSFRSLPKVFSPLICEMVGVAEEGGHLDKALANAATYLERASDLRKKIINAIMYPAVLTGVSSSVVIFLIVVILPNFAKTFKGMGAKLPGTTMMLIGAGEAVKQHPLMAVLTVVGLVFAWKRMMKFPRAKRIVQLGTLKVPQIGKLIMMLSIARCLQTLSSLLSGGVTITTALHHAGRVSSNPVVEAACEDALHTVENGGNLSESFERTKVFPAQIVQMVAVGERTGRVSHLIAGAAAQMERDADSRIKALSTIIEPLLIVVMGGIVGMITVSVMLPLYSLIEQVK